MPNERVTLELEDLRLREGTLRPEAIVAFAENNTESALHSEFEWDDSRAAHLHRLDQARHIIRVHISVNEPVSVPMRTYVSLRSDRRAGRGYRRLVDVMSEEQHRQELLLAAWDELRTFERKYRALAELTPVFEALDRMREEGQPTSSHDEPQPEA